MIQNLPWESHIPFTRLELLGYKVTRSRPFPPDERALFAAFLRRIYPTPNPLDTQAGYDTYNHTDLAGMSLSELRQEARKVQLRVDCEDNPSPWLARRLEAVQQQIAYLRRSPSQNPSAPTSDRPTHPTVRPIRSSVRRIR
jgi:hypothetical protein